MLAVIHVRAWSERKGRDVYVERYVNVTREIAPLRAIKGADVRAHMLVLVTVDGESEPRWIAAERVVTASLYYDTDNPGPGDLFT